MAGAVGTTARGVHRPFFPAAASRDAGLKLLASFPDLERLDADRAPPAPPAPAVADQRPRPRIGWVSIAILAVVAIATCTAAWWVDTGPIDPGAAEIERVRLAERADASATSPARMNTKTKTKTTRR